MRTFTSKRLHRSLLTLGGAALVCLPSIGAAQVQFLFNNEPVFQGIQTGFGRQVAGFESFETPLLMAGQTAVIDDPLNTTIPNGPYGPGEIHPLVTVQANDGTGLIADPRGFGGMLAHNSLAYTPGTTSIFTSPILSDSLDLILGGSVTGVGFDLRSDTIVGIDPVMIRVFGDNNILLGVVNPYFFDINLSNHVGIWSAPGGPAIRRINILSMGTTQAREGLDNVELWVDPQSDPVPEPITLALGAGAVAMAIRRRRKMA